MKVYMIHRKNPLGISLKADMTIMISRMAVMRVISIRIL